MCHNVHPAAAATRVSISIYWHVIATTESEYCEAQSHRIHLGSKQSMGQDFIEQGVAKRKRHKSTNKNYTSQDKCKTAGQIETSGPGIIFASIKAKVAKYWTISIKVRKLSRIFLNFLWICETFCEFGKFTGNFEKLLGIWESFWEFWKVSGNIERFWEFWKLTGIWGNLLGILKNYKEFFESFWEFWKGTGNFEKFPGILETYRNFWKLTRNFGKFLGMLKNFWEFWKFTRNIGNLSGILETYWEFWKVSGNIEKFPGFWKLTGIFGKFSGNLPEMFHPFATLIKVKLRNSLKTGEKISV